MKTITIRNLLILSIAISLQSIANPINSNSYLNFDLDTTIERSADIMSIETIRDEEQIEIKWNTVIDNHNYTIEKSINGIKWDKLEVEKTETVDKIFEYKVVDEEADKTPDAIFYRISQKGKDNSTVYSKIITSESNRKYKDIETQTLIDNNGKMYLWIYSVTDLELSLELFDNEGNQVLDDEVIIREGGDELQFYAPDLEPGVYVLIMHNEEYLLSNKVIKE